MIYSPAVIKASCHVGPGLSPDGPDERAGEDAGAPRPGTHLLRKN